MNQEYEAELTSHACSHLCSLRCQIGVIKRTGFGGEFRFLSPLIFGRRRRWKMRLLVVVKLVVGSSGPIAERRDGTPPLGGTFIMSLPTI